MSTVPDVRPLTGAGPEPPQDLAAASEPLVSVIIPALNEARNLPHVMARLPEVDEVILVDGGSTDDTVDVACRLMPGIRVVRQNRRGKGNALACGFAAATGDILVMIDADGSTDPAEIPSFLAALRGGADFAKGSRFRGTGGSADITRVRRLGNQFLNLLVNVLFGTRYTDLCYGYNAFWVHCLDVLGLDSGEHRDEMSWGDGFEIETVINTRIAKARLRIAEVKSYEFDRIHGTSNLNAVTDGLRVLKAIMIERLTKPAPRPEVPAHIQVLRAA